MYLVLGVWSERWVERWNVALSHITVWASAGIGGVAGGGIVVEGLRVSCGDGGMFLWV